jgi:hypothetical protein
MNEQDDETRDDIDMAWAQLKSEEQHRREQQMLSADPGYVDWLRTL